MTSLHGHGEPRLVAALEGDVLEQIAGAVEHLCDVARLV